MSIYFIYFTIVFKPKVILYTVSYVKFFMKVFVLGISVHDVFHVVVRQIIPMLTFHTILDLYPHINLM